MTLNPALTIGVYKTLYLLIRDKLWDRNLLKIESPSINHSLASHLKTMPMVQIYKILFSKIQTNFSHLLISQDLVNSMSYSVDKVPQIQIINIMLHSRSEVLLSCKLWVLYNKKRLIHLMDPLKLRVLPHFNKINNRESVYLREGDEVIMKNIKYIYRV